MTIFGGHIWAWHHAGDGGSGTSKTPGKVCNNIYRTISVFQDLFIIIPIIALSFLNKSLFFEVHDTGPVNHLLLNFRRIEFIGILVGKYLHIYIIFTIIYQHGNKYKYDITIKSGFYDINIYK